MTTTAQESGWQLTEGSAAAYERQLVPLLFDRWAADLLADVGLHPGERVVDVACGTGIVARHAAARVGTDGSVTGVDLNPSMLEVARTAGADADIRWEQADATALPLADGEVDVAVCQQGLQFFPRRDEALAELRRVTAPGGRLAVSTCRGLEHQPGYRVLADVLDAHVGAGAADMIRSPFALGQVGEIRRLVTDAGWVDARTRIAVWPLRFSSPEAFLRVETSSSPLGEVVAALDTDVIQRLLADLEQRLRPHRDDHGVVFPMETGVVTAHRG